LGHPWLQGTVVHVACKSISSPDLVHGRDGDTRPALEHSAQPDQALSYHGDAHKPSHAVAPIPANIQHNSDEMCSGISGMGMNGFPSNSADSGYHAASPQCQQNVEGSNSSQLPIPEIPPRKSQRPRRAPKRFDPADYDDIIVRPRKRKCKRIHDSSGDEE
jgi:hypothetical protein